MQFLFISPQRKEQLIQILRKVMSHEDLEKNAIAFLTEAENTGSKYF